MTSTLSFKIALIKLLIVSLFSLSILKANPPVLVNDTQANATATITASRMAEQIEKAAKMIEQYNEIIERAKATVGELNKINEVMNGVNSFLNGSSIQIANPFEPLKDIGDIFDRMKNNAQRLQKTLKNYEARDHLHWKKLSSNCPYLSYDKIAPKELNILFTNVGKESKEIKAMKRLANALSDDIVSNTQSAAGTLSGRALALEFCKKASELRNKIQQHECKLKMKEYILAKDFEEYTKVKKECYEIERQYKKDMSVLRNEQVNPLINRSKQMMEALGVLDKSYNKGKKIYCKEGKNDANEFCYPLFYDTKRLNDEFIEIQNELVTKLQKAGNDKTKQASAYADIKQKTDTLTLSYIKDIANNLGFMNETMALVGNLIARDYKNKYGEDDYDEVDKEFDKKVAEFNENYQNQTSQYKGFKQYKANLNKYGFPIVSFTSKKEDTD